MGNKILKSTRYIVLNKLESNKNSASEQNQDPIDLSNKLQKVILKLKGENIIDEKSVDYSNLVKSNLFKDDYLKLAFELNQINLDVLKGNDTNLKAFFINVYNSLTIHALTYLYEKNENISKETILKQLNGKFWSRFAYNIGGYDFSLDDIEHGVLRVNRGHPSSLFNLLIANRLGNKMFGKDDPRLNYVLSNLDPRIHFALNCGATSCPPVSVYTPANLEVGLELATQNFINSTETHIDIENKTIKLSQLFNWYKSDFANQSLTSESADKQLLNFIVKYLKLNGLDCEQLQHLINENKLKIVFSDYNWKINSKI